MRNITITISLLFLLTFCQGQSIFFVKSGVTLGNQTSIIGKFKVGAMIGLGYEYKFSEKFWIESGADYTSKGIFIGTIRNVTELSRRLTYLDIPMLVKYKYYYNEDFNWGVKFGPSLGVTTAAKERFFRIGKPAIEEIPVSSTMGISPIDFGLNVGIELNFTVGYGEFSIFTQAQQGLSNVYSGLEITGRNQTITTGLMVKFGKNQNPESF